MPGSDDDRKATLPSLVYLTKSVYYAVLAQEVQTRSQCSRRTIARIPQE